MNPQTKLFKPGSHLFHENDRSRELYVIQSGNVKIYRTQNGREIELAVLGKGSVFGEMALIDGRPRSASAKALDECQVSIIDAEVFHERIKGVPPWFMTIIKMTCQKIRNANRLLLSMGGGRHGFNIILALYYEFCRLGTTLDHAATRRTLSRLLGASEQNITRICEFLVTHGFVECSGNAVRVVDQRRLADYCDFLRLHIQKTFDRVSPPPSAAKKAITAIAGTLWSSDEGKTGTGPCEMDGTEMWECIREHCVEQDRQQVLSFLENNAIVRITRSDHASAVDEISNPLRSSRVIVDRSLLRQWSLYCTFNEIVPEL